MGYTVNKEFMLGANEGDSRKAQNLYIIVHETANPRATGRNEASNMKNNWRKAYTTHIVGDGIVYLIGEPGYVSWGALDANCYAPAQIELQHTTDKALFEKNYRVYVELIRDLCNQFGIPKTLDAGGKGIKGVKSHQWVTKNYGGDHTDPYGYLASMGISKEQFARDIANGFGSSSKPNSTNHNKPQSSSNHDKIIEESPAKTVNGMTAKLAKFREEPLGSFREAGWAHAGKENYNYCFIFLMDKATNKEVARQKSKDIPRPDVNAAYKLSSNNKPGFDTTIDIKKFAGKQVYVKVRLTNDPAGNMKGGAKDVDFPEYYLTIPKR
nr:MAG TPA: hypothetical protein [Caudoviricetes sp.]